jgi:hypothetical protein
MQEPLDIRRSRELSGTPLNLLVSHDIPDRYVMSLLREQEIAALLSIDTLTAVDLGLSAFLTFHSKRAPAEPTCLLARFLHRVRRLSRRIRRR